MNPKRLPAELSAWPRDPWVVLGIDRGVDRTTLRRAYTALLREFNPEHFPEHFRRIREAYEIVLQQVEWSESLRSSPPESPPETPPPNSDSATMDENLDEAGDEVVKESMEPPSAPDRPDAPADNPVVRPAAHFSASNARWHDDLEALWNRAVGQDEAAYRAIVDMESRFSGRRDLCLRLYWLLIVWPELDDRRKACDWLARGLHLGGLGGPLFELYRRELESRPTEALTKRCGDLLEAEASPAHLANFVEARWRAAGSLDQFELITEDLESLRVRLGSSAEETWARLILAASNELCWSLWPETQTLVDELWRELDELPHLHTRLQHSLDRAEMMRWVAVGWRVLRGTPGAYDLMQLVRDSLQRPVEEVRAPALALLHRLVANHRRLVLLFDRFQKASPGMLAQIGQLIAMCGGTEPPQPPADAGQILALARFKIDSVYRNSYDEMRMQLLDFCLLEQVSPAALTRMPNVVLSRDHNVNVILVRRIAADIPLQIVYLAHRALGA